MPDRSGWWMEEVSNSEEYKKENSDGKKYNVSWKNIPF